MNRMIKEKYERFMRQVVCRRIDSMRITMGEATTDWKDVIISGNDREMIVYSAELGRIFDRYPVEEMAYLNYVGNGESGMLILKEADAFFDMIVFQMQFAKHEEIPIIA